MATFPTVEQAIESLPEPLRSKVKPGDVIAGRDEKYKRVNHPYRTLIRKYSPYYRGTKNIYVKRKYVRLVIKTITDKGGRFLDDEGDPIESELGPLESMIIVDKVKKALKDLPRASSKIKKVAAVAKETRPRVQPSRKHKIKPKDGKAILNNVEKGSKFEPKFSKMPGCKIKKDAPVANASRVCLQLSIGCVVSKDPIELSAEPITKKVGSATVTQIKNQDNLAPSIARLTQKENAGHVAFVNDNPLINTTPPVEENAIKYLAHLLDAAEKDIALATKAAKSSESYNADIDWLEEEHANILGWLDSGGIFSD